MVTDDKVPGRIGLRERKKQEIHRRIRRAAAKLFAEKGYEATTVDEITDLAGVGKGTFFNYYPRKDLLLTELGDDLVEDLLDALGPREGWSGTGPEQLARLFLASGERVHRDPKLFKVMIVESMRGFWMRDEEDTGRREIQALIRSLIVEARDRGEFPADVNVEVAMKLIEAAYVTATIESLRLGTPVDLYRAEFITRVNVIFRGLGAEPVSLEGMGR